MAMTALEARTLLFNRTLRIQSVDDATIDAWESTPTKELAALKGQLSLLELKGSDTSEARKLALGSDGSVDEILAGAAMLTRSLVLTESKERVLQDSDAQGVSEWGGTVLTPLITAVSEVSGFAQAQVVAAKAFLPTTPANASSSSSVANSEVGVTPSGVAA